MRKMLWIPAALVCVLVFSCGWENNAADDAVIIEDVSPLAVMVYDKWPTEENGRYLKLSDEGVSATACCGRSHTDNGDGDAANAIDGNTNAHWHPDWAGDHDNGHRSDTGAYNGTGGYAQVKDYINAVSTDSGVQNGAGGHWITYNLGQNVEVAGIGYLARSQGDRTIRGYEIWVSDSDMGWDTSGASLVCKGTWTPGAVFHYAYFMPVTTRYIQIRQIYDSDSPYGCIVNTVIVITESVFPGIDKTLLKSLYAKGAVLLRSLDKSTTQFKNLDDLLKNILKLIGDETLDEFPIAGQATVDSAAASLQNMINLLDPPRKPPEVY